MYRVVNLKNETFFELKTSMDKIIQMEKHHIEAWGIWWVQWQQQTREKLREEARLVRTKAKDPLRNTATSSTIPLVLLPK